MRTYTVKVKRAGLYSIERHEQPMLAGMKASKTIGHIALDRYYVKSQQTWEVRFYDWIQVELNGASVAIVQARFATFAEAKAFALSLGG